MKRIIGLILVCFIIFDCQAVDLAKLEQAGGQFHVTATTYTAIVPPTGLLSYLKIGNTVMIDRPLALCEGHEWDSQSRRHLCTTITQPATNVLLCDGPDATLRYQFDSDRLTLNVTGKSDAGVRLFFTLASQAQAVWTEGRFLGKYLHSPDDRSSDYFLHSVRVFFFGETMNIDNISVFYGPNLMRCDAGRGQTFTTTWQFGLASDEDRKLFTLKSPCHEPLSVMSPLDYQVFQRQTLTMGRVRIAGRLTITSNRLEYRLNGGDWKPLQVAPHTGDFVAEFDAPAGGWYRCEVRALQDGKEVASQIIAHVGVGEVFVASGQSNSTNNGDKKLRPASGMVSTFSGNDWRLADDPQPGCFDSSLGGSFYPPLGDLLYAQFKVPIGFAVTGDGGTSVAQWHPGGDLFNWMEKRIQQLGSQGFRCVLWHQGEADGETPEKMYYNRLKAIIEQSNRQAGWSFPWMVAQVGGSQTRKAKEQLWADGIALKGPDSDTLRGPENRQNNGTSAHFTELGLKRHAALWAEDLTAYLRTITETNQIKSFK